MLHEYEHPKGRIPARGRWALSLSGAGLLALLAVAASLQPDASGLGTHQQLGLPPCTLRVLTGRPCPTCGMTTAWAHLVRGEPLEALGANAAGALLALGAIVAAPWMLLAAIRGRWIGRPPGSTLLVCTAVALGLIMLLDWIRHLRTT